MSASPIRGREQALSPGSVQGRTGKRLPRLAVPAASKWSFVEHMLAATFGMAALAPPPIPAREARDPAGAHGRPARIETV
jgi:hypothetical protein